MNRFRVVVLAALSFAALSLATSAIVLPIQPAAAADKKTAQQMVPTQEVRNLQVALNRKGARFPVDGIMSAKTVAALKAHQRSNKLAETGELDPKTKAAFGLR